MHTRLISWSRMVYLAGIVLALVLVIPTAWFPFQLAKVAIFATFLAISIVLFVIGKGTRDLLRTHGVYAALLVAILPLTYLVSAAFSSDRALAFTGFSVETDTVLFVMLAALAFILSFTLFRTLRTVRLLLTVVFWALVAATAFQFIAIIFGTNLIPFQTFTDRSVNLIGKWNDLGLLVGLLSTFLLTQIELATQTTFRRTVAIIFGALSLILLGIINFALAWGFLLVFAIALGVIKFLTLKKNAVSEGEPRKETAKTLVRKIPWYCTGVAVLALLCIFFGTGLNTQLTKLFPVSSLEVRPSYLSTLSIVSAARQGSFGRMIVGTGPDTFGDSWLSQKPAEVNQSLFWNLDFNVGFSTLVTALGTVGLLGVIAWLIPLLLVIAGIVRVVRLSVLSREEKITATTISLASLFLLAAVILYIPSQNIILLALTLAGSAFGFLWRQGQTAAEDRPVTNIQNISGWVLAAVLVVLVLWGSFVSDRRLLAESYTNVGLVALQNNDADGALAAAASSQGVEKNDDNLRLAIDAGNAKLQAIATNTTTPAATAQQQFAAVLQQTITAGQSAIALYPNDYRSYLSLGRVYDFLSTLKIQGAYDNAKQAYLAAYSHNPTDPEIALLDARLEATQGNTQLADQAVTQALTLKPNYTDAILFVVQLDVANNDIPNAIRAASAAAQTAPGVAPIWFELGLLYYAGNDMADAIPPLEKAIAIEPDYANAKYFLGLAYYNQKQVGNAIKEFEDLSSSNPDNTEVSFILNNLQTGRSPFASSTPPITPNPVNRTTAPLEQ